MGIAPGSYPASQRNKTPQADKKYIAAECERAPLFPVILSKEKTMATTRAAFIGVGAMGSKLAERILAADSCAALAVFEGRSAGTKALAAGLKASHGAEVFRDSRGAAKPESK